MKKIIILALALCAIISTTACSQTEAKATSEVEKVTTSAPYNSE